MKDCRLNYNHYIHIPFCNQKCPYCKFALTPVFDEFKKRRYIEYLKKEIREYFSVPISVCEFGESVSEDFCEKSQTVGAIASFCDLEKQTANRFQNEVEEIKTFGTFSHKSTENSIGKIKQTIYFGGGTPSILSHEEIREILECFPFYQKVETEITLESNPENINREYVMGLIELGINRLSMGVQTLNNETLTEIHRSDSNSIIIALEGIGEAIGNTRNISINIDFILGLPYTLPGEIIESIKKLHHQFPFITHTSVYMLEDEDYPKHWKSNSITEDEMQSEFTAILEYFQSILWNHYELSNWSKPIYESVHNQAYWDHSNSKGFGLSAASYENGVRWNNSSSFGAYYKGERENEEILTNKQIEIENMMFGLRTDGFNSTDSNISTKKIQENIKKGFLVITGNRVKPTKTGIFILDHIISELINI